MARLVTRNDSRKLSHTSLACLVSMGSLLIACEANLGAGMDDEEGTTSGETKRGKPGDPGVVCLGDVCSEEGARYNGPGEVPMRRLNNAEYENTLADLFGASTAVEFPEEGRTHGFDTIYTALAVSEIHIAAYLDAADEVVEQVFSTDPGGITSGWCDYLTGDPGANVACAEQIVADFADRAWRRSIDGWPDGRAIEPYHAMLSEDGTLGTFSIETRLRTSLAAVLTSSRFIYRVEFADQEGQLDDASLASRLSYFLWSSAPDDQLRSSTLSDQESLTEQAQRLRSDAKFDRFKERFPDLWLGLEKLDDLERDPDVYPTYSPALGAKMAAETGAFVSGFIGDPDVPVATMLSAAQTPPTDADLAALYGSSPRQGLMTQASIMALTGVSDRTSPVRRGMWVLEALLCDPPPDPPAAVIAELAEDNEFDPNLTERERLSQHREDPSCAGCHVTMDAIGLGFENYDSIGAYREVYANGNPIDPSGVLPVVDAPFEEPLELVGLLAADERFPACVVRKLLTYGAGRDFERHDDVLVDVVQEFAGGAEMSFQDAIAAVVLSDAFRLRDESEETD